MRHEETGWPRGAWAAREKIPEGYASALENCDLLADGAARSRRGAAVFAEIVGQSLRHGRRYVSNGGCVDTVLIAASGNVYERNDAGVVTLLGSIAAAADYSSAQAEDRLYIATGAAPAIITSSGGSCSLGSSGVGLPTPPAPTLISVTGGGGGGATDPADPSSANDYLVFDEVNGRIYGAPEAGTAWRRFALGTGAWTESPAIPARPKARVETVLALGTVDGHVLYLPNVYNTAASAAAGASGATNADAFVFRVNSETWDAARALENSAGAGPGAENYVHPGSSFARARSDLWNATRDYLMVYTSDNAGGTHQMRMAIVEIAIKNPGLISCGRVIDFEIETISATGGSQYSFWTNPTKFQASVMCAGAATNQLFVAARRYAGTSHFFRCDVSTGARTELAAPPWPVSRGDLLWTPSATSQFVYAYRDGGTEVYRFNLGTNAWESVGPTAQGHARGMTDAAPTNQQVYYQNTTGNDFETEFAPGITGPGGGAATHTLRYVLTQRNAVTESPASAELVVSNVPDGASITIGYPAGAPGATAWRLYRTLLDGAAFGLRREDPIATTQIVDTAVDTGFLNFGQSPPGAGAGGGFTPTGASYVMYDGDRTWWMRFTGARSDAYFSRSGVAETFAATWVVTFAEAPDDDELVGAVVLPTTRVFFKRRQIWSFTGDPGEPPTDLGDGFARVVDRTRGANAPRSIAAGGKWAYFVATDGIYRCDGASPAQRISDPIELLIPADTSGACGFVDPRDGKYYVALDAATFAVWDPEFERWEATRLSFEVHRGARAVFASFAIPDLARRVAIAGDRAISFADRTLPSHEVDRMRVEFGPIRGAAFEDGVLALHAILRYSNGDGAGSNGPRLDIHVRDMVLAPIALPAHGPNARRAVRALPTRAMGRRVAFSFSDGSAPPNQDVVLHGASIEWEPLPGLRGAA